MPLFTASGFCLPELTGRKIFYSGVLGEEGIQSRGPWLAFLLFLPLLLQWPFCPWDPRLSGY